MEETAVLRRYHGATQLPGRRTELNSGYGIIEARIRCNYGIRTPDLGLEAEVCFVHRELIQCRKNVNRCQRIVYVLLDCWLTTWKETSTSPKLDVSDNAVRQASAKPVAVIK